MSKLLVVPVDFKQSGENIIPVDADLCFHVMEYCRVNLSEIPDLTRYRKVIAIVEYDGDLIIEVHGVSFMRMVPDIAGFRVSGPKAKQATVLMQDRWQAYFADNGWRGDSVFIWIDGDEKPEQQCENRAGSVEAFGLRPAKRMLVKVQ